MGMQWYIIHTYSGFERKVAESLRTRADGTQIPYVVCGNMGHGLQRLSPRGGPVLRAPQVLQPATKTADQIVFERYDDGDYGYLRVIVSQAQLRIEYHPSADGSQAKTPDDSVTVDLATRKLTQYVAKDLGHPAAVRLTAKLAAAHPATWTAPRAAAARKKKKTKR